MATEVDHKDNDDSNNTDANLIPYCKACHSRKTYYNDSPIGKR